MIVYVAFKFDGVKPDSERADAIVREITESCETMQIGFDANACWVDNAVLHPFEKGEVSK
jgi:L-alanine-DL-glutamate epimerase-like enolase superfamily enzyme